MSFEGTGIFNASVVLGFNVFLLHAIFPFTAFQFSYNSVSWSISTEMFFYFMFPVLALDIGKTWIWKLATAGLLTMVLFATLTLAGLPTGSADVFEATIASATYANPFARLFEFMLGMASWVIWDKYLRLLPAAFWHWTAAEAAVLALAGLWLIKLYAVAYGNIPLPWMLGWFSTSGSCWVFALLIIVLASGRGLVGGALSLAPMVWLGEISFCVYMVHQILFKIFAWNRPDLTTPLIYFAALTALATAMYYCIEKPGRALIRDLKRPRRRNQTVSPVTDALT